MGHSDIVSTVRSLQKVLEVAKGGEKSPRNTYMRQHITAPQCRVSWGDELLVFGVVVLLMLAMPKIYQEIDIFY